MEYNEPEIESKAAVEAEYHAVKTKILHRANIRRLRLDEDDPTLDLIVNQELGIQGMHEKIITSIAEMQNALFTFIEEGTDKIDAFGTNATQVRDNIADCLAIRTLKKVDERDGDRVRIAQLESQVAKNQDELVKEKRSNSIWLITSNIGLTLAGGAVVAFIHWYF